MRRRVLTLNQILNYLSLSVFAAACTFDTSSPAFSDPNQPPLADGAPSTSSDAEQQVLPCPFDQDDGLCEFWEPKSAITINSDELFNTDNDPRCQDFAQPDGQEACLLLVDAFAISKGKRFTAIGSRPLLIASPTAIEINGLLDVSSDTENGQQGAGANDSSCSPQSLPEEDRGGGGGGAGGSFAGRGGDGGNGDTDRSVDFNGNGAGGIAGAIVATPKILRGGCPGTRGGNEHFSNLGGGGGDGGGAVALISGVEVRINNGSIIRATGAGGLGGPVQTGGGGGGSGGLVRIKAPTIVINGRISCSGGGGGEGGLRRSNVGLTGQNGQNGQVSSAPAAGGAGTDQHAGDGGNGSSDADLTGQDGQNANGGGGGGGGGAGFILLRGTLSGFGETFPGATVN